MENELLGVLKLIYKTATQQYPDAPWIPGAAWKDIEPEIKRVIDKYNIPAR